jgi:hypothetical protein
MNDAATANNSIDAGWDSPELDDILEDGDAAEGAEGSGDGVTPSDSTAGAGPIQGEGENQPTQKASQPGGAAPQSGTPAKPEEMKELLAELKGKLTPEQVDFLKSQGVLRDDGKTLDFLKLHGNWNSALQYNTQTRQAMSHVQSQINALRQKEEEAKPVSREELKEAFQGKRQELNAVFQSAQKLASGSATPEEIRAFGSDLVAWASQQYDQEKEAYDEKLRELHTAEVLRQHGVEPKGGANFDPPEAAKQKATDNVLAALPQQEQGADRIKAFLGSETILQILNGLAATMFPRQYGKGASNQEIQQNNNVAVNRVLAHSPELAKSIVDAGRSVARAKELETKLVETERAAYQRGFQDAAKGKAATVVRSAETPVKPVTLLGGDAGEDVADSIASSLPEW